jgi:hypothetical protein
MRWPPYLAQELTSLCVERYRYSDLTRMTLEDAFLINQVLIITALPQEFSKHMSFIRPTDKV